MALVCRESWPYMQSSDTAWSMKGRGFSRSSLTPITVGQLVTDLNPRMDFRSIQALGRLPGWETSECMLPACHWCWCLPHLQSKSVPATSWLSSKNKKGKEIAQAPCHQCYGSRPLPAFPGSWVSDQAIWNNTKTTLAFFHLSLREPICANYQCIDCQLQNPPCFAMWC